MQSGNRKLLLILFGVMASLALLAPVCSYLCPENQNSPDLFQETACGSAFHSFVEIETDLSIFFTLHLLGLFFSIEVLCIPSGFFLSIFKPPEWSS